MADDEDLSPPAMPLTHQEMADAQIPLNLRDCCAHLFIPLEKCRRRENFLPWKCHEERHAYEACEYKDYVRRVKVAQLNKKMKKETA